MMEISQSVSDVAGSQQIGDQGSWPITKKRTFNAAIAVRDTETIVLGGLVRRSAEKQRTGVPYLSSIPLLGRLFSYNNSVERRSEIVVFITPYVLDTPESIAANARKHRESLDAKGMWETDWSSSKLADKTSADKAAEKKRLKERRKVDEAIARSTDAQMKMLPAPPPLQAVPAGGIDALPKPEKVATPLPATKSGTDADIVEALDPALIEFIEAQEKKWGKKLKEIDRETEINLK
jgi:hypothetical protein